MDKKPFLDLHPSEWSRDEKHEPVLGVNGLYFLIMFALGFPISIIAGLVVYGELPYFLQHLLQ